MARRRTSQGFLRKHSLSLILFAIVVSLFVAYRHSDPDTHHGAFFGNALADWLGTLVFIIATKYFFEVGSKESRQPNPAMYARAGRFLVKHSLTIVLALTGAIWAFIYSQSEVDSKAGTVVGNIVSEWTQILGLVIITKYAGEIRSKESDS